MAVIPVVLFHAGFETFKGGFLGVDVFFVISGFLITSIIIKQIEEERFTLKHFLERRARRILPPLFGMMLICSFLYLTLLSPSKQEAQLFGESIFASTLFFSNIYFAISDGYFAATSEILPFIHTWSLSVEEQFYIFYPPLFLLLYKFGSRIVIVFALVILFGTSLMLAQFGADILGKWHFYILPTRIWELIAGAICAVRINLAPTKWSEWVNQIFSLVGIVLIALSIFSLDASISMPSIWGLLPVTGTILILICCSHQTWCYRILSNRILINIGIISYSIYLWHQPIFAFFRHLCIHPSVMPTWLPFLGVSLTIGLATLSYHFLEKPFRAGKYSISSLILLGVGLLFISINTNQIASLGWNPRSPKFSSLVEDIARNDYGANVRNESGYFFGAPNNSPPHLILFGNSHARMLIPNLSKQLHSKNLCGFHPCKESEHELFQLDEGALKMCEKAKMIVISTSYPINRWNSFHDTSTISSPKNFHLLFEEALDKLYEKNVKVFVVGPVPDSPEWGPNLGRSIWGTQVIPTLERFKQVYSKHLFFLENLKKDFPKVEIIYPHEILFSKSQNRLMTTIETEGNHLRPLYYDDDHLNYLGSEKLVQRIFD